MQDRKLLCCIYIVILNLLPYVFSRGSARGGQGVISAYFAKMTSKFGFLAAFGGHS